MPTTGLAEALERLPPSASIGLFAPRRADAVPGAAVFLRTGLALGEKCLLLCSRRFADDLLRAMGSLGCDVAAAVGGGSLLVDPDAGRPGGIGALLPLLERAVRLAAAERRGALRLLVDPSHALVAASGPGGLPEDATRLRAFLSASSSPSLFVYPESELPPALLLPLLSRHPWFLRGLCLAENVHFAALPDGADGGDPAAPYRERVRLLLERHDEIARLERQAIRLSRLRDVTLSLLSRADEADLYRGVVEGVVALGHSMCWLGLARPDGSVEPVASSADLGYLREVRVRWDDTPEGRGPVGLAIRHRRPEVVADTVRSRRFAPWRRSAEARGYRSVAAFPIEEDGRAVGALAAYSSSTEAFGPAEVEELSTFALLASLILRRGREVDALRASEGKYRSLVESAGVCVVETGCDGTVRLFNRAAEAATGYDRAEVLGRDYRMLVPDRDREGSSGRFRKALAGRETEGEVFPLRTRDGGEKLFSWHVRPLADPAGRPAGILSIGVEVRDRPPGGEGGQAGVGAGE